MVEVEVDIMPPPHSREESAFVGWALPTIASLALVQNGGQCPPYGLIGFAMIGRDESRPYENNRANQTTASSFSYKLGWPFVGWAMPTIASLALVQNGGQCPPYGLIGFATIGRDESRPYEIFAFAAPNWSMFASTRGFGMTH